MASPSILIIGASRGLGYAMTVEFIRRGWNVTGTVRGTTSTQLHDLADRYPLQVRIEQLDICDMVQIKKLQEKLQTKFFDILFVNAGTTNQNPAETVDEVDTDDFINVMVTNALSPMRVINSLARSVRPTGMIAIMSSGQGSIANNVNGLRDVYRGSKAALNQYMKGFAARQEHDRPLLLMAPGWVKTELGGEGARYTIDEVIPSLVNVVIKKRERPGLEYLDFKGQTVPW